MARGQVGPLLRAFHELVGACGSGELTDGELLRCFAARRDEEAFAALVRRHGPMVLRVCRHVLGQEQDAEDACQATFLVLARKAGSVRNLSSVAAWLFGVAQRTSLNARRVARRRHQRECRSSSPVVESAVATAAFRELQVLLDAEVRRLPSKYRAPFVLCCLEGKGRAEAARALGWKEGTVAGRLARARAMLQHALARRGVAFSAALTACAVTPSGASAALTTAVVRGAVAFAAGVSASTSTRAVTLANGVLKSMTMSGTRTVLAWVVVLGLLASGVVLAARQAPTPQAPEETEKARPLPRALVSVLPGPEKEAGQRLDRFGDPLPPGALVRMGTVRFAQGDATDGYPVLAPDQQTFATVSHFTPHGRGRVVCLWDATTGKELRHIEDPDFEYYRAFFLRKENLLATLGVSRKPLPGARAYVVHFWDPTTGKKAPFQLQSPDCDFEPVAVSPNDKWLATASRVPPVLVRDLKTGRRLASWEGSAERVGQLDFSPAGDLLAIGCGKTIHLWDWKGNRERQRLGPLPEDVERLWFSPDGKWFAAAIYKEGLRVWETDGFSEVRRFKESHVRFVPGGNRLIALDTGIVRDLASGEEVGRFENCAHCLTLDFSRDGKTATGYALGRIRRWDAATGKDRTPPGLAVNRVMIHQVGFLPDGKAVVSACPDGGVHLWDAATGNLLRTLFPGTAWGQPVFLRVAADGTIVVGRGKRLSLWHKGVSTEIQLDDFPGDLSSINVSPDGKHLLLAGGSDKKKLAQVWDFPGRKAVARFPLPEQTCLEALGISSGGEIAACVGDCLCLLNGRTGAVERTLERRPELPREERGGGYSYFHGVQALAFAPEGDRLVSAGHPGGGLKLLDVSGAARRVLLPPAGGGHYELRNAVFSPDGRMVAAEAEDGLVEIWETLSGQRRRRFLGHRSYQTALAFSPDGRRLATGNRDATILVWDVFGIWTDAARKPGLPTAGELDALWARLQDADAERACLALGGLLRCPDVSVPFLKRHLLGRKGESEARLKGWLADLDSDQFDTREVASRELGRRLVSAAPLLKEALAANPSPEVRQRIERLLEQLEQALPAPETLRDLRAIEVLEHLASPAAKDVLRELAGGNRDPQLTVAARKALKRLGANAP